MRTAWPSGRGRVMRSLKHLLALAGELREGLDAARARGRTTVYDYLNKEG